MKKFIYSIPKYQIVSSPSLKSFLKKYNAYLLSILALFLSSLLLFNLSPASLFNGTENNLQPMPSVSVDLNGKSNISYQIEIPEGTKGMNPNLSLQYNSAGGYGNMGVGWNLSGFEWITRDATYGIDYTANDQFTSTLGGSLVKGSDGNYFSRRETFLKFVPDNNDANKAKNWYAYDKSGNKYTFTTNKEIYDVTAVWALTKVEDIYNNSYSITYSGNTITMAYSDRKVVVKFTPTKNVITKFSFNSPIPENAVVDNIVITAGGNLERKYSFTYALDVNGKEILTTVDKSEKINGNNIDYTSVSYKYSETIYPISFKRTEEFSNPNSFARVQIPMKDKLVCLRGEEDCLQYALTTCSPELANSQAAAIAAVAVCTGVVGCDTATQAAQLAQAVYTQCTVIRENYNQECNKYKNTWFMPCMGGLSSPMPIQTQIDINGDGKQEIAVVSGSTRDGTIHIENMVLKNDIIVKSSVSGNLPGLHYTGFQSSGFGDVDGDGKTDFAYSDGSVLRVAFSNGTDFDAPVGTNVSVPLASINYRLDGPDFTWKGGLVDINGDGRADYIKVKDGASFGIYLSQGKNLFSSEISVNVGTVFQNEGSEPQPGQFLDINGDGIPEYVFIEANSITAKYFNSAFNGLRETKSYSIPGGTANPRNRWLADLNRDGKVDFITLNADLQYIAYLFDGVNFIQQEPFHISDTTYSTKETPMPKFFVDINGDGFADIVRHCNDGIIRISFGKGLSFNDGQSSTNHGAISFSAKYLWSIADLNGDGYLEIISLKETEGSMISGLSPALQNFFNIGPAIDKITGELGGNNFTSDLIYNAVTDKYLPQELGNYIGLLQVLETETMSYETKTEVFIQESRKKENQIIEVDGGLEKEFQRKIMISYDTAKNLGIEVSNDGVDPTIPNPNIGEVVKTVNTIMGSLLDNTDTYSYSNNRIWMGTPENITGLGFKFKTVTSSLTGVRRQEEYNHSSNLFAGTVVSSITENGAGETKQTSSAVYKVLSPLGRPYAVLESSSETVYKDDAKLLTTTQDLRQKDPNNPNDPDNSYDKYGNLQKKITHSYPADSTSTSTSTITETSSYTYDTTNWILNRPIQTTKKIDGMTVENTTYSYLGNSTITVTSMAGTVGAATSTITLDEYGNQSIVQDQVSERKTYYEYDSVVHNYITKVTNPTGFSLTKTYDTSLGLELMTTDANGGVLRKEYDKKGRLIQVFPPGFETYVERYEYTDYASNNENKYFTSVAKSVVNADGTESTASEYFDLLGRSIRKESPGVQGKFIIETTEYDTKGQVTKKSNPFLDGLETNMYYTTYTYHTYDGYVTKVVNPDKSYSIPTYTGFNEKMDIYGESGTLISSMELIKNAKGQVLERKVDGKSLKYQYDAAGRTTKILDPENGETTTVYDDAGRKISVTDPNSGTTVFTYDQFGNIKTQKTANNVTTTFTYDKLNRPTLISYNPADTLEFPVDGATADGSTVLTYDEGGKDKFANGRLTKVVDAGGTLELGYDIRGNRIYQKRHIEDLHVIFTRTYDIQNRLESITYPDKTKVYQKYASTGHFSGITMDTFDGSSFGHTVGSYTGPVIETSSTGTIFKIIRETGNGVKQEIEYDPIKRRPVGLFTKLPSGNIESQIAYEYDERNNMTKIVDKIDSTGARTQEFVYDAQNRLKEAKGKYGIETYTYSDNGNLLRRGRVPFGAAQGTDSPLSLTYTYGNANHKHAVTLVTSPSTGVLNYSYDPAGNMSNRNGDTMFYNGQGKLKEMKTAGGDTFEYLYDSSGNRIRKKAKNSGVITYNFDGLYEITKAGSEGGPHTLYFKGLYGDVFAQMTRGDAVLRGDVSSSSKSSNSSDVAGYSGVFSFAKGESFPPDFFVKDFFCSEVAGSCSTYYLNAVKFYWVKGIVKGYTVISRVEFRVGLWIMLIVMVYLLSQILSKLFLSRSTKINEDLSKNPLFPLRLCASVASISILFTFTQCGVIRGDKSEKAPWMLLASGINQNTARVDTDGYTPYGGNGSSSGGGNSSLAPVTGMYFLHPDHLGSITMITDGSGNVVTGLNNEGKSHISYKPYGEILRTDSGGPDISKFKYTGQEEDKESGLMYYKARYYDPVIGRFLQADSMAFPERIMGMNRYMYVEGNPMKFSDGSGNIPAWPLLGAIAAYSVSRPSEKGNVAKDMMGGVKWAAKSSGVDLASKPVRNLLKPTADAFNKKMGQDYGKRSRVDYGIAVGAGFALGALIGANYIGGTAMTNYIGGNIAVHGIVGGMVGATLGMFYELGVRGGLEAFGNIGLATSVAANGILLASAMGWIIDPVFEDGANAASSPGIGLLSTALGIAVASGNQVYERNREHRADSKAKGCYLVSRAYTSVSIDLAFALIFRCHDQYREEVR